MSAIEISGNDRIDCGDEMHESSAASGNAAENAESSVGPATTQICADIGINEDFLKSEQTELLATPVEGDPALLPPPPPPPTPGLVKSDNNVLEEVASKLAGSLEADDVKVEKSDDELWETPCAPPPPPPLPASRLICGNVPKGEVLKLRAALEDAKANLTDATQRLNLGVLPKEMSQYKQKCSDVPEDPDMSNARSLIEPGSSKPLKTSNANTKPASLKGENNNDEELLSLQVLSARSSTPYTRPTSCTSFSCELEHISECVSPVKDSIDERKANVEAGTSSSEPKHRLAISQSEISLRPTPGKLLAKSKSCHVKCNKLRYDRAHLLRIRTDVRRPVIGESVKDSLHAIQVFDCNELELHVKLRSMNILKWSDQENRSCTQKLKARQNEMMPSFYKRKYGNAMDESIIKSYPPQPDLKDSVVAPNQRRIGSGRVQQNKYLYPKTLSNPSSTEKMPWKEAGTDGVDAKLHSKPLQRSSHAIGSVGLAGWEPQMTNGDDKASKANYVKPLKTGFLLIKEPKGINASGRHRRHSRENNEEPEWFSAGPTSRLDTIELRGFEEDERAEESEKGSVSEAEWSSKNDTNNNANPNAKDDVPVERGVGKAFQFDEFAASTNQRQPHTNSAFNRKQNSEENQQCRKETNTDSTFLPFFGGTQPLTCEELEKSESSTSLNDFFKKAMNVQPQADRKEKNHQTEPQAQSNATGSAHSFLFADQLEANWRRNSLTNNDANNNNLKRGTENFKKLMGQLNNNVANINNIPTNQSGLPAQNRVASENITSLLFAQQQARQQAQQHQQMLNQQHNLQFIQQQQTANLAFLQMKAILNRPDAQSLLLKLQKGEISKYGLVVQLSNPNLSQYDREAITAVLTVASVQQQHQQQQKLQVEMNLLVNQLQNLRNLAIVQQTVSTQQQPQQQQQHQLQQPQMTLGHGNRSPVLGQGQVLSANELRAHTNFVLQNALLNRKREEQQNLVGLQKILQSNATAASAAMNNTAGMNLQSPTNTHRLPVLQSLFTDTNSTNNGRIAQSMQLQPEAPRNYRGNYLHQRRRFYGSGGSQMKFNIGAENQQNAMNQYNRTWNGMNSPRYQANSAFSRRDELH